MAAREVVIDYEFLRVRQNETVVKESSVASASEVEAFHFKIPYKMADHGSPENGLNLADGHIEYMELQTVLTEAVDGFAQPYAYGLSKCTFLAGLMGRPIHNLEDLSCPHPSLSITNTWVYCRATSFPNLLTQPKPCIHSTIN